MNNRRRGHNYEREIRKDSLSLGFEDLVTTRSESRNMDDRGVDLFTPHYSTTVCPYPFYGQCKLTTDKAPLNVHKLFTNEKLPKDKPFVVYNKVTHNTGKKFIEVGHYVTVDYDYFNFLLKNAYFNKAIYTITNVEETK